jgi:hypothetical protein
LKGCGSSKSFVPLINSLQGFGCGHVVMLFRHFYSPSLVISSGVTFRVTTAGKAEKSELPSDGAIRVRSVRAVISPLHSRGQGAVERGHDLRDSVDNLFDPLGDGPKTSPSTTLN